MEQITFTRVVSKGCGLDVHRKVVVATTGGEGIKKAAREFGTFTSSLTELRDRLLEYGITRVAMESTGVYRKPVYHILEPTGLTVWVVSARHIKYVSGHKTDRKDSARLCRLLLAGLLKPGCIPARERRELRDLTRYRKTRSETWLPERTVPVRIPEDCNIRLLGVLSQTGGVTGTKLIHKLIDGHQVTMQDIDGVYHRKLKASKEELLEACNGYVTGRHSCLLRLIKRNIESTEAILSGTDSKVREILSPCGNVMALLKDVPGLNTKSIEDPVAETGRLRPRLWKRPGRQQKQRIHFTVRDITGWQQDGAKRGLR